MADGLSCSFPGPAARLRPFRRFVNTESMPPVGRVIETCLHADPLDRAVEFYSRVFGFPKLAGEPISRNLTSSLVILASDIDRGTPKF